MSATLAVPDRTSLLDIRRSQPMHAADLDLRLPDLDPVLRMAETARQVDHLTMDSKPVQLTPTTSSTRTRNPSNPISTLRGPDQPTI